MIIKDNSALSQFINDDKTYDPRCTRQKLQHKSVNKNDMIYILEQHE